MTGAVGVTIAAGVVLARLQAPSDSEVDFEAAAVAFERVAASIPARMQSAGVPGLAIALVDREGIVASKAYGATTMAGGSPIGEETLFSVQSISKAVTATAVMLAVQEGILELDAPVSTYLPTFTVQFRFHAREAGKRPEAEITLRHLLSHRAGLTHEAPVSNNHVPDAPSFEAHVESISRTWLRYPVGERYAYSNLGIDVAGWILSTATKRPFPAAMRERLLEPIGMETATFDWTVVEAASDRAIGHLPPRRGVPLKFWFLPSGALYASLRDVAAFVRFHLDGGRMDGEPLLREELLARMRRAPFPGVAQSYGLGLDRMPARGFTVFNHNGGGFGFQAHMGFCVELGLGLVILSNDGASSLVWELRDQTWAAIVEAAGVAAPPLAGPESPVAVPATPAAGSAIPPPTTPRPEPAPEQLARVAGTYVSEGMTLEVKVANGRALLSMGPGREAPLEFVAPDTAFAEMGGRRRSFRFHPAADGRVAWLESLDDGRSCDWNGAPGEAPGPDLPRWRAFEGTYDFTTWGEPGGSVTIRRDRGWLCLDGLRLTEHEPGLFFSVTGEALDLRPPTPTWANVAIRLRVR